MKRLAMVLLIAVTAQAFAQQNPARKAEVFCDFKTQISADSKSNSPEDGRLRYLIDLDSKNVSVSCIDGSLCLLDGSPRTHKLTSFIDTKESFDLIFETSSKGLTTVSSNLMPMNIEGRNGDDMDMFTRLTFSFEQINDQWKVNSTGILIYADEGNDGTVSLPTPCTVNVIRR